MRSILRISDIIALGFMLFAFFLGAGNIIFPPLAGQLAGSHYVWAMSGFLVTAVGLPLAGILAIAVAGGSWEKLSRDLPIHIATLFAVLMYIIIGPAFAVPRTGLVAFEMAVKPLLGQTYQNGTLPLAVFSIIFFAVAVFFAWSQGKLIDLIGKVLTPALFIGLIILAVTVFLHPLGIPRVASGGYQHHPLSAGFLDGYNTMDTFGSLIFGMLLIDTLRSKGIDELRSCAKYLVWAAGIAAVGLAFVYVSLFYLGATSASVALHVDNGGTILSLYTQQLFGHYGQLVLSGIVLLACLTTAIGLISACSEYFARLIGGGYRYWIICLGCLCALVTNIGLSKLIELSKPVLYMLYPVAIVLVALVFIRSKLADPKRDYRYILTTTFVFALIDTLNSLNIDIHWLDFLPGFSLGMSWLWPSFVMLIVCLLMGKLQRYRRRMQTTSVEH
ncbi:branched-chain amino acid transport system II carrier protein [Celerinatantimonas sp. YJH-8]|uniref:branched-chain amino acid transport system II carrier protein n=1 Tax=Celerinatantimonas sp. YJH-8 TaxID=3228714 RepID=UPI0038C5A964